MAGPVSVAKLEGVQSDACTEQIGPKMKIVRLPCAINEPDRFEVDVLKFVQATQLGGLGVGASAAKSPISLLDGNIVDDIVARCDLTATATTDLFLWSDLASIHFH